MYVPHLAHAGQPKALNDSYTGDIYIADVSPEELICLSLMGCSAIRTPLRSIAKIYKSQMLVARPPKSAHTRTPSLLLRQPYCKSSWTALLNFEKGQGQSWLLAPCRAFGAPRVVADGPLKLHVGVQGCSLSMFFDSIQSTPLTVSGELRSS